MGKAKRQWWGYAKSMVARYPDKVNEDEKRAVEAALRATRELPNGETRVKIIELMYFKRTHQLAGAALQVHYSYDRAKQWHTDFIHLVGSNFRCEHLK